MRIIVVAGARPNFIKIAPIVPLLEESGIDAPIAHTGQHFSAAMSDVFFSELGIPEPRWHLGVGSGTHAVQTGKAMMALEELLMAERPDAVLVVGDVNSTLAGALAASKIHVSVVHLEAGLRSRDMTMPEEVNRLVTDQLSAMLLTPTEQAGANLMAEGIEETRVRFVGNIMAESVLSHLPKVDSRCPSEMVGLTPGEFVLATFHRPENTDYPERLIEIVAALRESELPVLFPVHPRTRPRLVEAGLVDGVDGVRIVDPVGYLDMLALQRDAAAVMTDSGGIQEETCMLRTPCVTVRRNTERDVTLEVGSNRLVSAVRVEILDGLADALASHRDWETPKYWDGLVSRRVADAVLEGVEPL